MLRHATGSTHTYTLFPYTTRFRSVEILDAANLATAIGAAFLSVRGGLFLLPGAEVAHDAEIMVGELQIIFGLDPVARKLRVARKVAIFFAHLGAVAARPAEIGRAHV